MCSNSNSYPLLPCILHGLINMEKEQQLFRTVNHGVGLVLVSFVGIHFDMVNVILCFTKCFYWGHMNEVTFCIANEELVSWGWYIHCITTLICQSLDCHKNHFVVLGGWKWFQEKLKERERELRKRKEREEQEMERIKLKVRRKEAVASYQALLVETIKDPQVASSLAGFLN